MRLAVAVINLTIDNLTKEVVANFVLIMLSCVSESVMKKRHSFPPTKDKSACEHVSAEPFGTLGFSVLVPVWLFVENSGSFKKIFFKGIMACLKNKK